MIADAAVEPGTVLVRAVNGSGASAPRFLLVDRNPIVAEKEPNDALSTPQPLASLPAVVEGRLEKPGDIDAFRVRLQKGSTLVARVECHLLASPVDPVLRVLDAKGTVQAWNHDHRGTMDPFIAFEVPMDGEYRIELFGFQHPADSEVRFTGNSKCVYRLHLTDGPWVDSITPSGLSRHHQNTVSFVGWNLPKGLGSTNLAPLGSGPGDRWATVTFPLSGPGFRVPLGDGPELREQELSQWTLPVPGAVTGALEKPGELDPYAFAAQKDQRYQVEVLALALGSPLDPSIRILDGSGKELVSSDRGFGDLTLEWKAPGDGMFTVVVGSPLTRRSPAHRYRLEVRPVVPGFKAVADGHALVVEPGKTNEFKVRIRRTGGLDAPVQLIAGALPEGVAMEPVIVPAKDSEAVLRFTALTNVGKASLPLTLKAVVPEKGLTNAVAHEMATTGENNGVPQGFSRLMLDETDWLWLTVPEPAGP